MPQTRRTVVGMHAKDITTQDFDTLVDAGGILLVDFWATWCGPCRSFAPIFEAAAEKNQDIVFAKVDTEAAPDLANRFAISSIPTLMVFRDGVCLYSQAGALPAHALDDLISKVRGVDMDAVRSEM